MATPKKNEDPLDERDGPNKQFKAHHDVTYRKGGGMRILPNLERLLSKGYIKPEQSEAGRRFVKDYERGEIGRGRSSMDMGSGGNGDGVPEMDRLDAIRRVAEAEKALLEANLPGIRAAKPGDLLVLACVRDCPVSQIAQMASVSDEVVKSWIAQHLAVLAVHYAGVDRISGRSSTVYTKEAALKRFEPEL